MQPTRHQPIRAEGPVALTGLAESDGRRSDTGGAPIVRFFVAARSAPSLVSMLESEIDQSNRKMAFDRENNGLKYYTSKKMVRFRFTSVVFSTLQTDILVPRRQTLDREQHAVVYTCCFWDKLWYCSENMKNRETTV